MYETAACAKDRQKDQVLLLATEGIYSYQRLGEISEAMAKGLEDGRWVTYPLAVNPPEQTDF